MARKSYTALFNIGASGNFWLFSRQNITLPGTKGYRKADQLATRERKKKNVESQKETTQTVSVLGFFYRYRIAGAKAEQNRCVRRAGG